MHQLPKTFAADVFVFSRNIVQWILNLSVILRIHYTTNLKEINYYEF